MKYTSSKKTLALVALAALLGFGSSVHAESMMDGRPPQMQVQGQGESGDAGTRASFWTRIFRGAGDQPMPQGGAAMMGDATASMPPQRMERLEREARPAVMGTVSAISGTTVTLTGKDGKTYAVDASAAVVTKGIGQTSTTTSLSAIPTGETVIIMGTLTGANVTASRIIYSLGGAMMKGGPSLAGDEIATGPKPEDMDGKPHDAPRPVVVGSVTAVTGTTITLTGKDSAVITVDASDATFIKAGDKTTATTIAGIAVGDTIAVEGTATGSTVTATKVVDNVKLPPVRTQEKKTMEKAEAPEATPHEDLPPPSFFKKVGSLLGHLKFW